MAGLGDSLIIAPLNRCSKIIIEKNSESFQFSGCIAGVYGPCLKGAFLGWLVD
jgi:hypothetical protein